MSDYTWENGRTKIVVNQMRLPWSRNDEVMLVLPTHRPIGAFWFEPHPDHPTFYPRLIRSAHRETLFSSDDLVLEGVEYEEQEVKVRLEAYLDPRDGWRTQLVYEIWGLWQNTEVLSWIRKLAKEWTITDTLGNPVDPSGDFRDHMNHVILVRV